MPGSKGKCCKAGKQEDDLIGPLGCITENL